MKPILFVQLQQYAYPGLYYLCGALRARGHRYAVIAANRFGVIAAEIERMAPALIAFPCLTGMHVEILRIAAALKASYPDVAVLLGGVHPTLFPAILENPQVDFICRGEGEFPTCELLEAVENGARSFDIPNISWKKDGRPVHNPMRPLIDPLDSLPFPDYSIYSRIPPIAADTYPQVYMTRGCPFACSYCHNSKQREIFKGLGRYVRSFGHDRILAEVEAAIQNYPAARAVFLGADTLGTDLGWLSTLLRRYAARFNLPYTCLIRPEFITDELVRLLRETNCHMLAFGIESGSERIRRELLSRHYSNERLVTAAALLKKYGVRFRAYNIIGFPGEHRAEMLETLDLNQRIAPDFPWCSIYTPYPQTGLSDYCLSRGYLPADFSYNDVPPSFFNDTILQNVDRRFILNLHSFFQIFVAFPRLYRRLKFLLALPPNRLFRAVFKITYLVVCMRAEKRSLLSFTRLALANRRLFR